MEYIDYELEEVNKFRNTFESIFYDSVMLLKDDIKKIIKERWLKGEGVNGGPITNKSTGGGYASLSYKSLKLSKNPLADGNVDLTLTGSLGDKITIKYIDGNFEIVSEDPKYFEIGNKYGFDEFGLNAEEMYVIFTKLENLIISNFK